MENIDLNRLKIAITYAERIADGKNPVTNAPAREEDVINNPNVIRCMFFIRDVLQQVYNNDGKIGGRQQRVPRTEKKTIPIGGTVCIYLSPGSGYIQSVAAD